MVTPSARLPAECQPENVQRDDFCPPLGGHGAGIVSGRARRLESLSVGGTSPYDWRQIKVTCAKWTSRVSMLRVEFSAEFKQVVN